MAKLKHNAYSVFVDETFRRRRNAGENSLDRARLFSTLSAEWSTMASEQKQRYKDKAKDWNENPLPISNKLKEQPRNGGSNPAGSQESSKPSSSAEPVDCRALVPVKRPHEDDSCALVEAKKLKPGPPNFKNLKGTDAVNEPWAFYNSRDLLNLLNRCSAIVDNRYSSMDIIPLYSISTNVLCKERKKIINLSGGLSEDPSKINPLEDKFEEFFTPIEISIYTYSLKSGKIGKPYWVLINAGDPPQLSRTAAMDHQKNHKITFSPLAGGYHEMARDDYVQIYGEILKYTEDGERILLVSNAKDIPQVRGSLEWLYNRAVETNSERRLPQTRVFTILPVVEYIASMHNLLYEKLDRPTPRFGYPYYVRLKLEGSIFDYNSSFMCPYHSLDRNECLNCAQVCAMKTFENLGGLLQEIYNIYTTIRKIETTDNAIECPTNNPAIDTDSTYGAMMDKTTEEIPKQISM